MLGLLRLPLGGKLAGANALIVLAVIAVVMIAGGLPLRGELPLLLSLAFGGSLAVNLVLVAVALRPLRDLQTTAERIWHGDLNARVPSSLFADPELGRLRATLNVLLDGLTQDREQMRRLANEVIRAGDRERAHIARELHDGTAQTLAALVFQAAALELAAEDTPTASRAAVIKSLAADAMDEVRGLAHTVHPRVLDDLGLIAGLQNLARHASERDDVEIEVDASSARDVPAAVASVLYRIAQEAVGNALRHAKPSHVTIRLQCAEDRVILEVTDDGRGFDVGARTGAGMGLFTMRERAMLADGTCEIMSAFGEGTCVRVDVPLPAEPTGI
jgi:signal transduction histidine kinase